MASKLEINIRSLIVHCEEIVKNDPANWLLKKYIKSLDTMIKELEETAEYAKLFRTKGKYPKIENNFQKTERNHTRGIQDPMRQLEREIKLCGANETRESIETEKGPGVIRRRTEGDQSNERCQRDKCTSTRFARHQRK